MPPVFRRPQLPIPSGIKLPRGSGSTTTKEFLTSRTDSSSARASMHTIPKFLSFSTGSTFQRRFAKVDKISNDAVGTPSTTSSLEQLTPPNPDKQSNVKRMTVSSRLTLNSNSQNSKTANSKMTEVLTHPKRQTTVLRDSRIFPVTHPTVSNKNFENVNVTSCSSIRPQSSLSLSRTLQTRSSSSSPPSKMGIHLDSIKNRDTSVKTATRHAQSRTSPRPQVNGLTFLRLANHCDGAKVAHSKPPDFASLVVTCPGRSYRRTELNLAQVGGIPKERPLGQTPLVGGERRYVGSGERSARGAPQNLGGNVKQSSVYLYNDSGRPGLRCRERYVDERKERSKQPFVPPQTSNLGVQDRSSPMHANMTKQREKRSVEAQLKGNKSESCIRSSVAALARDPIIRRAKQGWNSERGISRLRAERCSVAASRGSTGRESSTAFVSGSCYSVSSSSYFGYIPVNPRGKTRGRVGGCEEVIVDTKSSHSVAVSSSSGESLTKNHLSCCLPTILSTSGGTKTPHPLSAPNPPNSSKTPTSPTQQQPRRHPLNRHSHNQPVSGPHHRPSHQPTASPRHQQSFSHVLQNCQFPETDTFTSSPSIPAYEMQHLSASPPSSVNSPIHTIPDSSRSISKITPTAPHVCDPNPNFIGTGISRPPQIDTPFSKRNLSIFDDLRISDNMSLTARPLKVSQSDRTPQFSSPVISSLTRQVLSSQSTFSFRPSFVKNNRTFHKFGPRAKSHSLNHSLSDHSTFGVPVIRTSPATTSCSAATSPVSPSNRGTQFTASSYPVIPSSESDHSSSASRPNNNKLVHSCNRRKAKDNPQQSRKRRPVTKSDIQNLKNEIARRQHPLTVDDFELGITVGTGTFGRVRIAQYKKDLRGPPVALKIMKKSQVLRMRQVEHVKAEKHLLSQLKHPFITALVASFQDEKCLYVALEFVHGGELFSHLRRRQRLTVEETVFYASEITVALDFLHRKKIAYRDLKPENLLIDSEGHLKLTDFGFAKVVEERTWTLCGTPEYLAPEIIKFRGHGISVDWWALGVLIYEMICGYAPFRDDDPFKIYEKILAGRIVFPPNLVDSRTKHLLKGLMAPERLDRLGCSKEGAKDVKSHPWFAGIDWDSCEKRGLYPTFIPQIFSWNDTSQFDSYDETDNEDDQHEKYPEDMGCFADF